MFIPFSFFRPCEYFSASSSDCAPYPDSGPLCTYVTKLGRCPEVVDATDVETAGMAAGEPEDAAGGCEIEDRSDGTADASMGCAMGLTIGWVTG